MFGRRFARRFFWGGPLPWWGEGPQGRWEERGRAWFSPEQQALRSTGMEVARLFAIANRSSVGNPEKQAQLRAFLERSRKELSDIIYGTGSTSASSNPSEVEQV